MIFTKCKRKMAFMDVTKIENVTTNKYKIFLDEEFAFVLYKGELSRYHIKEGGCLKYDEYEKIKKDVVIKRAKKRVLHLLEKMARSEEQIRTKLRQSYYTEDVINEAIDYAKKFGYINDLSYARSYAHMKMQQKSKKEIYFGLLAKGIEKEIVTEVLEELFGEDDEKELITKLIRKKNYDLENLDRKQIQKINGFLMRKGFQYDQIKEVMEKIICGYQES